MLLIFFSVFLTNAIIIKRRERNVFLDNGLTVGTFSVLQDKIKGNNALKIIVGSKTSSINMQVGKEPEDDS